jgi:hypothetical protein
MAMIVKNARPLVRNAAGQLAPIVGCRLIAEVRRLRTKRLN